MQAEIIPEVIEAVPRGLSYIWELGLAGSLFLILMFVFYRVWRDMKVQREDLRAQLKAERDANTALTAQMLEVGNSYATSLLATQKETGEGINDVTNALNQLVIMIKEMRNDINSKS